MIDAETTRKVMEKLTYGLFVLTAKEGHKNNGCIIDTAMQVTVEPNQICICVNRDCLTHDMIKKTDVFNVSIISEKATIDLFKRFGFQSGRDVDKFENYKNCECADNGVKYITEGTNAYISAKVTETKKIGTHTMFIGEITDMKVLDDAPSATYAYYQNNIKPKPQGTPTSTGHAVWRCSVCGYEYDAENLPRDFTCPVCNHSFFFFERANR